LVGSSAGVWKVGFDSPFPPLVWEKAGDRERKVRYIFIVVLLLLDIPELISKSLSTVVHLEYSEEAVMFRPLLFVGAIGVLLVGFVTWGSHSVNAVQNMAPAKIVVGQNILPCPDPSRTIQTSTPPQARTPRPSPTGTVTPRPTTIASGGLFNVTQNIPFDVVHSIVLYDPGVTSTFLRTTGSVSLIIIEGEVTLCSGNLQRVLITGETWILPENIQYRLANTGTLRAYVSVVRLIPRTTPTVTPTGTVTQVGGPTNTPTGPAFLGIQVAAIDNTALRILRVLSNSPAAAAQLQRDDVILAIDGTPLSALVSDMNPPADESGAGLIAAFFNQISSRSPGTQITLTIQRGSEQLNVQVTLSALQ
jgi:hypothetical protein